MGEYSNSDFFGNLLMIIGGIMFAFGVNEFLSLFGFLKTFQRIIILSGLGFLMILSGYSILHKQYFFGILFAMICSIYMFFIILILFLI